MYHTWEKFPCKYPILRIFEILVSISLVNKLLKVYFVKFKS